MSAEEREVALKQEIALYVQAILDCAIPYEFLSFLLGASHDLYNEEDAGALKRAIGCQLCVEWLDSGRDVDWRAPDMVFILSGIKDGVADIEIRSRAIFVYGRYRKHERGISQTRWVCRRCKGKGCENCHQKGRHYEESVQEYVSSRLCPALGSTDLGFFHGMGREDVDVRMLGRGRPFVYEILEPKKRSIDLEEFCEAFNKDCQGKVTLQSLKLVNVRAPALVKGAKPDKSYRAFCKFLESRPSEEQIQGLSEAFQNMTLEQRTPQRVSQRRADLVRKRTVRHMLVESARDDGLILNIRSESGTYIKELVSSDEGRTVPSITEYFGVPCVCAELDVLEIHIDDDSVFIESPSDDSESGLGSEEEGS